MDAEKIWSQYQSYSKDLTDSGRKLAFVAGAICWVFKESNGTFPLYILLAMFFLVCFFIFDLLHSFSAAIVYKKWIEKQESIRWEKEQTIDGEYLKPKWLDRPAFTCWIIKFIMICIVYIFIAIHIIRASLTVTQASGCLSV